MKTNWNDRRSDTQLIADFRLGKIEAINVFIERHRRYLYSFCLLKTRNTDDAKDLLQTTYLKIIGAFTKTDFVEIIHIRTWMCTIALRTYITDYRREQNAVVVSIINVGDEETLLNVAGSMLDNPEEIYIKKESKILMEALLDDFISHLDPRMQQVFTLRFKEDKTYPEIAEIIGVHPTYVKNLIWQGKAKIIKRRLQNVS